MTSDDTHDPMIDELRRLQSLAPDHGWTDRVRTRCRTHLERSQARPARTNMTARLARRVVASVVVGGFCVLYIAALVTTTLRLHGVFHGSFIPVLSRSVK